MKVAIIGAGISGLSCAIELQKHGITPVIFEKTKMLGDKPGYLIATLRMFYSSLRSPMSFIKSKYGISIVPEHPINEMVMVAPNKTVSVKGNHGYAFLKGIEENSLEHQLASFIDAPIQFDSGIEIQDIKNNFDYIIVANGDRTIPNALNLWTTTYMAKCRLATISGDFDQNTLVFYLNKSYGKNGYGYLLARSANVAELLLAVSDITMDKLDYYWNEFLITENIKTSVIKYHDFEHSIGYPSTNQFENLYFAGNCGGMIDDFLGFGTLRAIESGVLAARSIVQNKDYNRLLVPFKKEVKQMYEYRKMLNVLTNKDLDMD
jgi:digeranylgeranylglycerophospholipid reductase